MKKIQIKRRFSKIVLFKLSKNINYETLMYVSPQEV